MASGDADSTANVEQSLARPLPASRPASPSGSGEPAYKDAEPPFDDPDADFIIRSSDDVDFHVHRTILALASSVFKDMLKMPPPAATSADRNETRAGVPVVRLSESARVLDLALRFVYPIRPPQVAGVDDIHALLAMADKYRLQNLEAIISSSLDAHIDGDPVGVYALCVAYDRQELAKKAAVASLELSRAFLRSPALRYITGAQYNRLLDFHLDAARAASAVTDRTDWYKEIDGVYPGDGGTFCLCCWIYRPRWFLKRGLAAYLAAAKIALRNGEGLEDVTAEFVQKEASDPCRSCGRSMYGDLPKFAELLKEEVAKEVGKVDPPDTF